MSEANVCRLCVNPCGDYRQLYDDPVVYEITVNYFDPMFLNLQHHLTSICMTCWSHIVGFHSFQQSVLQAQTKFVQKEGEQDSVCIKSELSEFQDDPIREDMPDNVRIKSELSEYQDDPIREDLPDNVRIKSDLSEFQDVSIREECYVVSDVSQSPTNNQVVVKDELVLTDGHREIQFSSDEEMSFHESVLTENKTSIMTDKQNHTTATNDDQANNDTLKTDLDGDKPKRKTTKRSTAQKRKSIRQLDDLIAQWRPTLECLVCHRSFSRFTLLQTHFRQEHPDMEFYVLCCETKFRRRYSIEEHIRFHKNQGEFDCKICGKGHTNKLNLSSHMTYWHSTNSKPLADGNSCNTCDECGKPHPTAGALRKHKHRHKHQRSRMATPSHSSPKLNTLVHGPDNHA